jgi:hypothetical protein
VIIFALVLINTYKYYVHKIIKTIIPQIKILADLQNVESSKHKKNVSFSEQNISTLNLKNKKWF